MDENKIHIIFSIKKALEKRISNFYIIGSFFKEEWNPKNSDIDIVCIDESFEEYPYFENIKYVKDLLHNLPYKIDIFIYSPKQFNDKLKNDLKFCEQIIEGADY